MMSVLVSFFVEHGMCVKYPNSNKGHPWPPEANGTSFKPQYPNCTNYTAVYTGLSLDTLGGNIYGLYGLCLSFFLSRQAELIAVSYTHLTLPTIYSV